MLNYRLNKDDAIMTLRPNGPLNPQDFERIAAKIDPFIKDHGQLNGIIIEANEFPGWQGVDGFLDHLKFVREHYNDVAKVATVSNSVLLSQLPKVMDLFASTKLRGFEDGQAAEARRWILGKETRKPSIDMIPFANQPVIGFRINGRISKDDVTTIMSEVDEKLKSFPKLGIYVEMEKFHGATFEGLVEDLRLALPRMGRFSRKAVVCDQGWVKRWGELLGPLFPKIEFKTFRFDDKDQAKQWSVLPHDN